MPSPAAKRLPVFAALSVAEERIREPASRRFARQDSGTGPMLDDRPASGCSTGSPAAELVVGDGEYRLKIAAAGFCPDEIALAAHDVFRRFVFPRDIDVRTLTVKFGHGVLTIEAPYAKRGKLPDFCQAAEDGFDSDR